MSDLKRLAMLTSVRRARLAAQERRLAVAIAAATRAWAYADAQEAAALTAERRGLERIARERNHLFVVKFTVAGVSELRATVVMVQAEISARHADARAALAEAEVAEAQRRDMAYAVQIQRAKVERLDDEVRLRRRQRDERKDAAEVSEFAERAVG
jgi:hypothetical protein